MEGVSISLGVGIGNNLLGDLGEVRLVEFNVVIVGKDRWRASAIANHWSCVAIPGRDSANIAKSTRTFILHMCETQLHCESAVWCGVSDALARKKRRATRCPHTSLAALLACSPYLAMCVATILWCAQRAGGRAALLVARGREMTWQQAITAWK